MTSTDGASKRTPAVYEQVSRPAALPDRVKKMLLTMISSGQLAPGDRLPAERDLASDLGVSRNVVREALRSLVDANVLQARQGAGVFVASLDVESLIEPLDFVFSLERAALHSLVVARLVIEPGIAALAATRVTDEDLAELDALLERSRDDEAHDTAHFLETDVEIHGRIVRIADNPFLTRIMESLGRLSRTSRQYTNPVAPMRHMAHEDHERIVAALHTRDPDAAYEAMRRHIQHVADTLTDQV